MAASEKKRAYIAIDLKSFYASVECAERGLDPLNANLVVADETRTRGTICLAVSPALKSFGVPSRPRLFEVEECEKKINLERAKKAPGRKLSGESIFRDELLSDDSLLLTYVVARPRMSLYIERSAQVYKIYLKFFAPEDIVVYSIDEVFVDATAYLKMYDLSAERLAAKIIKDVYDATHVTATAGVGTNLFLAKVAMDIVAKHSEPDESGARVATLDEKSYRERLWDHEPVTDFWRVGKGYERRLSALGLKTMGDIARASVSKDPIVNEDALYKAFGVEAELLIDHAWGYESCTIKDIKSYRPEAKSVGSGQVLPRAYTHEEAALIVREMCEELSLKLVEEGLVAGKIVLYLGFDSKSESSGETKKDYAGRTVPKPFRGTESLGGRTSSTKRIAEAAQEIFERSDPSLLVRRVTVTATDVLPEGAPRQEAAEEQLTLFESAEQRDERAEEESAREEKERRRQEAEIKIRRRYGKNALLKGMDLLDGATTRERNEQIGGHRK